MTYQSSAKKAGLNSLLQYLKFDDIDLSKAYIKSLYYTSIQKEKGKLYHYLKYQVLFFRALFKLLSVKKGTNTITDIPKHKIVVKINSIYQVQFWLKTISELPSNEVIFLYEKQNSTNIHELERYCETENLKLSIVDTSNYYLPKKLKYLTSILKAYFKILFCRGDMQYKPIALQFYINSIISINYTSNFYSLIKPKAVLTLADEVNPFSSIFNQIIHKHGGKVINSMNGIKGEEHRNSGTNFDAWLIWSQAQYEMLTKFNKIPKEQLFITGHLHADTIYDFRTQKKPIIPYSLEGYEKVIAVFSQPYVKGYEQNRQNFLTEVNHFFSEHKNYLGIIKPHPRESRNDFYKLLDLDLPNIRYLDKNSNDKNLLYSIISISDCMIVMYSTVAIEGLFFEKPVFSFCTEGLKDPLAISDKLIPRFKNHKELQQFVRSTIKKKSISIDEITYEIGWRDGNNYKQAAEVIKNILSLPS